MEKLNLKFYRQFYKHYLNDYSDSKLRKHWETDGQEHNYFPNKESLLSFSKFDWKFYAENNLEIPNLKDENDYTEHWVRQGIYEGRNYRLDLKFYEKIYSDLLDNNLSEESLLLHWYLIGKNEGRICCRQELYKIDSMEHKIKKENLKELEQRRELYSNLEIENGIAKEKIEKEFSQLISEFLDNEIQKNKSQIQLFGDYYTQYKLSLENKNNKLQKKNSQEQKEILNEEHKKLKLRNDKLNMEIENRNSELQLKIINLSQQRVENLKNESKFSI